MLVRLDPTASVGLAEQIAAQIRGGIAGGTLPAGSRLAPARELAESLEVNMHTVLRAYQTLRDEGLIELRPGRGASVSHTAGVDRARLVQAVQRLLAEARRLGMSAEDVVNEIRRWS